MKGGKAEEGVGGWEGGGRGEGAGWRLEEKQTTTECVSLTSEFHSKLTIITNSTYTQRHASVELKTLLCIKVSSSMLNTEGKA